MIYKFVKRSPITGIPEVVGEFDTTTLRVTGVDADKIKMLLNELRSDKLDGRFNPANPSHTALLPDLIHGSYFWVAKPV